MPRTHRTSRVMSWLAVALLGGAPVVTGGVAWAEPPSDDDVAAAHAAADAAALDVDGAQSRLDAIRAELARAEAAVQTAAEDYAEAREALAAAQEETQKARDRADRAQDAEARARSSLAEAYRTTARANENGLGPLDVVTGARDVGDVVSTEAAQRAVDRKIAGALARQADLRSSARNADARWQAARTAQQEASEAAESAFATARRTADDLAARTAAAEHERDRLFARLADLRSTSVALERQREADRQERVAAAREADARERAEDAAASSATSSGATEPRGAPGSSAEPQADRPDGATADGDRADDTASGSEEQAAAPDPQPTRTREPAPDPAPRPDPKPDPKPDPPPVSGVGQGTAAQGREALAWARSKIGVAYQWGGDGDPGYDCSGLTAGAWNAAGVWITRTSRSQYLTVGKVSYGAMRPGDLIFYANDTSDPSTIRHVAIYAGGGMMVEAPRPGIDVREAPVRWDEVMPYAGRP
ncbi:C40 family peptidase [Krasilnikoviella flava]|uniref:Cell wall-associated hydrolase, NlpC family n=1 Tax=Krasilnikoviella flava TaxID=526729 RepID=A0A1T5ILT8_9MICO|nr:C40 family peptidase [Krasilnikoviella flava]SKC39923.1 Cell wall-associated hydrolase, NlpC family [Krasilnikoviella flava]